MNIKILIFLILINFLKFAESLDKKSSQLTLDILKHSDVIFLTDKIPLTKIPSRILEKFQVISLEKEIYPNLSKIFSRIVDPFEDQNLKIILDFEDVDKISSILLQIGENRYFANFKQQIWILVLLPPNFTGTGENEENKKDLILSKFSDSARNFTLNTNLIFGFQPLDNISLRNISREFQFYELYSVKEQIVSKRVHSLEGVIELCGLEFNCQSKISRRFNFEGISLKCVGVEDPESTDDTDFEVVNGNLTFKTGFSVQIMKYAGQVLNFNPEPLKTNKLGSENENGSWDGMVKIVHDGRADIGISSTIYRVDRGELISFLPATNSITVNAFFKTPSLNAIRDIFMAPFKLDLWAAVFSTWFVLAFTMILFSVIRKRYSVEEPEDTSNNPEPDFTKDSFIWALCLFCQQGWDEHPAAFSLRAIFITGSFTGVIAYAGYSAAIVSTLSLQIDPIQNPEQLLTSNLRIGLKEGLLDELSFETKGQTVETYDDVIKGIIKRLSPVESERSITVTQGYELLEKRPYAFICFNKVFYDSLKNDIPPEKLCSIRDMRVMRQGFKTGPFVAKKSPYKEFLKIVIFIIRERGILWRLNDEFSFTKHCLDAGGSNQGKPLKIVDVFTSFMILCGGYILCLIFLIFEKISVNKKIINFYVE